VTALITYDAWKPIAEWNGAGGLVAWNLYGPGADEVLVRYDVGATKHVYYHLDAHGHVQFLLDADGAVLDKYTYDAFGQPKITDGDGAERTTTSNGNRFLFTGREYLSALGLYDYRHRVYHPGLGRFLQVDPMGLHIEGAKLSAQQTALYPAGTAPAAFSSSEFNLYRYCHNDPVNHNDPMGLMIVQVPPVLLEATVPRAIMPRHAVPRELLEQAVRLNDGKNRVPLPDGRAVDLGGRPHFDKATGQRVPTPHVHEPKAPFKPPYQNIPPGRNAVPRPAKPDDIREVIRYLLDKLKKK
jgi:RHS repeat-associated protein